MPIKRPLFQLPMIFRRWCLTSLGLTFALLAYRIAAATPTDGKNPQPFVSSLFGDSMVLQRDKPNRIWGWTEPGKTVSVESEKNTASAVAGADGKWMVELSVPPTGGPYTVTISEPQSVALQDVCVGDACLYSG